jgi:histidinol dehydrogenase/sulfopropanediol 3-dehydrogenase
MINLKAPSPAEQAVLDSSVTERVSSILDRVFRDGERALSELNHQLDDYEGPILIREKALNTALAQMDKNLRNAVEISISHVRSFHKEQKALFRNGEWEIAPGVRAGMRFLPVKSAGVYIPGGRYPLVSTAIMGVVPAQEAGASRIVAFSPPRGNCGISKPILGTLALLGVKEVLAVGGAQGVGALVRGLPGIPAVDLLVGPGNAYVTEAKRQLYGKVGIDSLAGPSEVFIIADRTAKPEILAADLLAQAEHDPQARVSLYCLDETLAYQALTQVDFLLSSLSTGKIAAQAWTASGTVSVCSLDEAVAAANRAAPEHLELAVENPREVLEKCTAYGAAFLGHHSAEAFGDYIAGTNHVLPTEGRSRFSGGLWVGSFLRPLSHLEMTKEAAVELSGPGETMALAEGLQAHALAMRLRGERKS